MGRIQGGFRYSYVQSLSPPLAKHTERSKSQPPSKSSSKRIAECKPSTNRAERGETEKLCQADMQHGLSSHIASKLCVSRCMASTSCSCLDHGVKHEGAVYGAHRFI